MVTIICGVSCVWVTYGPVQGVRLSFSTRYSARFHQLYRFCPFIICITRNGTSIDSFVKIQKKALTFIIQRFSFYSNSCRWSFAIWILFAGGFSNLQGHRCFFFMYSLSDFFNVLTPFYTVRQIGIAVGYMQTSILAMFVTWFSNSLVISVQNSRL